MKYVCFKKMQLKFDLIKEMQKKISREVSNIVMEIKLNYHTYNPNWCDLTKEEYYKSLNEYTIKNNEYFYKLYKQRLKKYGIDIIFKL